MTWAPTVNVVTSPNYDIGPIAPRGIVVHGTDSGVAKSLADEETSSIAWLCNTSPEGNPNRAVSAHSLAGPGRVTRLVLPPHRAWHARTWNDHLGIELVHAIYTEAVDPLVLRTAAWECAQWVKQFNIPLVWGDPGFQEHREVPPGIQDGKVDVSTQFDHAAFLDLVASFL